MVNCPRCDFQVDETVRTTCPLCFTPLNVEGSAVPVPTPPEIAATETAVVPEPPQVAAASTVPLPSDAVPMPPQEQAALPQVPVMPPPPVMPPIAMPTAQPGYAPTPPQQAQSLPGMQQVQGGAMPQAMPPPPTYAPGSAPRPGMRVSLTGEVIEDSAPAAPTPSYVGGAIPPPRPAGPVGGGARRPVREEAPDASKGNPVAAIILTVMFLVAAGAGGWWFLSHRTNPKDQATKYFAALQKQDWKALYPLVDLSEEDQKRLPDADAFEKEAKEKLASSPFGSQILSSLKNIKFTVGEAKIEGDAATVPITLKANVGGQEQSVNVPMELVNKGGWKVKQGGGGMAGAMGGGGGMMGAMGR